jgi:gliding motility-associated-like protein
MTDIKSDPIYTFLQICCSSTNISTNSSVCASDVITLTSSNGTAYNWSGPNGFTSSERNPLIPDANPAMAGAYIITVSVSTGCTDKDTLNITVKPLPVVKITSSSSPMRINDSRMLTGSPAGGTFSISEGPGTITGNVLTATRPGIIKIEYNYADVCANKDSASITVNPFIPSVITPNGDGKNDYFLTGENTGQVELIIFNRWGIEEYKNNNYLNDWDGRDKNGVELPDDTYFYILKFEDGNIIRGSVLIKR